MKRHVQTEGVRKWAGDDLLELQGEPLAILDLFFGAYGPHVLAGCELTPSPAGEGLWDVTPGLVVIEGADAGGNSGDAGADGGTATGDTNGDGGNAGEADGSAHGAGDTGADINGGGPTGGTDGGGAVTLMVVPFRGATGVTLPLYLTLARDVRRREYADGGVKPVAHYCHARASTVPPDEGVFYLLLNEATPRFVDAIQDGTHSFITEAERTRWNGLLPKVVEYVDALFEAHDPTKIGELRQFTENQSFDNPDYLPCDGSIVDWEDYPDVGLPVKALENTVIPLSVTVGYSISVGCNGVLWVKVGWDDTLSSNIISSSEDGVSWTQRWRLGGHHSGTLP